MDAKEKAIAACENCLISRNIGRVFKIGWCTNVIREDGVGSTVYEDGLYVWADTGYGDTDRPCWEWENRPYLNGLKNAFHKELAAILSESIPFGEAEYVTPENEYYALSNLLGRVTVDGKLLVNNVSDTYRNASLLTYTPVNNPATVVYVNVENGSTIKLSCGSETYSKVMTGHMSDDMFELLIAFFDMIDD